MPAPPDPCVVGCHASETAGVLDGTGHCRGVLDGTGLGRGRTGRIWPRAALAHIPTGQGVLFPSLLSQGLVQKATQLVIPKHFVVGA